MNQDYMEQIVKKANVSYQMGSPQSSYNMVRFYGIVSPHSLNLGYSEAQGKFIADFVFKGATKEINNFRRDQFNRQYSGESGNRSTAFSRIYIPFGDEIRLVQVIQAYWKINLTPSETVTSSSIKEIRKTENYRPTKLDVELAASQIPNDAKGDLDVVLDQIGKNVIADSETLIANWREITEKNIAIWFK